MSLRLPARPADDAYPPTIPPVRDWAGSDPASGALAPDGDRFQVGAALVAEASFVASIPPPQDCVECRS